MTTLTNLIERLEKATEGSVELDIAICEACSIPLSFVGLTGEYFPPHRYTTSLDAALTLVPEGWSWAVLKLPDDAFSAGLQKPPNAPLLTDDEWPTPALAFCIAALKARQ